MIATALTDAATYPEDDLSGLYRARWTAELDIRSIKTAMGLDMPRCKTPAMLRKEISACVLAYGLIRQTMLLRHLQPGGRRLADRRDQLQPIVQSKHGLPELYHVPDINRLVDDDTGKR